MTTFTSVEYRLINDLLYQYGTRSKHSNEELCEDSMTVISILSQECTQENDVYTLNTPNLNVVISVLVKLPIQTELEKYAVSHFVDKLLTKEEKPKKLNILNNKVPKPFEKSIDW